MNDELTYAELGLLLAFIEDYQITFESYAADMGHEPPAEVVELITQKLAAMEEVAE